LLYAGVSHGDGVPAVYGPSVRYRFTVAGVQYESTRFRFGGWNIFSYSMTASALSTTTGTETIKVSYDPRRPTRCCLMPGLNEWTLIAPITALVFGAGLLALGVWGGLKL
jgi:hypothetical protein